MKVAPVVTLVLLAGIAYVNVLGGGIENIDEYLKLKGEVAHSKEAYTATVNDVYSLASSGKALEQVDKFVVEDIIKASGSTVVNVKLLTLTAPTKVIAESSDLSSIPDGGYYEFEVACPDIPLLLKKLDDNYIVCDVSAVPLSNKVFIKVLTGGAFK